MKRTSLTLAAMLSIMPATIAHAQFGSGIVFDPTQSAHAFTQRQKSGPSATKCNRSRTANRFSQTLSRSRARHSKLTTK
jgi:hypothetical protein